MVQESNLPMSYGADNRFPDASTSDLAIVVGYPIPSGLFPPSQTKIYTVHTHIYSDFAGGQGLEPL